MSIRSFIAIDTPEIVRSAMIAVQSKLRASHADVRWEPKEKLHATIKFLGNVDESVLPAVAETIGSTVGGFQRFEITYASVRCFPSIKRPRVLWIGCENKNGTLVKIKDALDETLEPYGFQKEDRAFHPHVTLGRVKSSRGLLSLTPILQSIIFEPHSSECGTILLMKSALTSRGSEYSIIQSYSLSS